MEPTQPTYTTLAVGEEGGEYPTFNPAPTTQPTEEPDCDDDFVEDEYVEEEQPTLP